MSNFLSKGKRQIKVKKDKARKKIFKKFNSNMKVMEYLYYIFSKEKIVLSKDNLDSEINKYTNIKLSDAMKKLLLDEFKNKEDKN